MIAAIYTRIVVVVVCLLVLATSASAECAWVLWDRARGADWTLVEVHLTAAECSVNLADRALLMVTKYGYTIPGYTAQMAPSVLATQRQLIYEKGTERGALHCLPDTLDPRGPKGGQR